MWAMIATDTRIQPPACRAQPNVPDEPGEMNVPTATPNMPRAPQVNEKNDAWIVVRSEALTTVAADIAGSFLVSAGGSRRM